MTKHKLPDGTAHKIPSDLAKAIAAKPAVRATWESLTPLARNEWICWTITVKQQKTRDNHIKRTVQELSEGIRRPCCWMGCVHRKDKKISPSQKWALSKR